MKLMIFLIVLFTIASVAIVKAGAEMRSKVWRVARPWLIALTTSSVVVFALYVVLAQFSFKLF